MLCPPAFAYEVIEKLLESETATDERTEIESCTLKKTCQIVKGASHSQYDLLDILETSQSIHLGFQGMFNQIPENGQLLFLLSYNLAA